MRSESPFFKLMKFFKKIGAKTNNFSSIDKFNSHVIHLEYASWYVNTQKNNSREKSTTFVIIISVITCLCSSRGCRCEKKILSK